MAGGESKYRSQQVSGVNLQQKYVGTFTRFFFRGEGCFLQSLTVKRHMQKATFLNPLAIGPNSCLVGDYHSKKELKYNYQRFKNISILPMYSIHHSAK